MSYRIELIPPARVEIRRLSGYVRTQALRLIRALGAEPRPPRARELRGEPNIYRIWLVGRWRIVYEVVEEDGRLLVLKLQSKDEVDYDSLPTWEHESDPAYDSAVPS